jgi:phosphoribosyl 1,2-cyclic phosphodiesterase
MWFCSLYSGSSGNCIYVGANRTNILIDAGLSGKSIIGALDEIGISPKDLNAILVTHEHDDHIRGVGILSRRFNIPIFANNNTWMAMKGKVGEVKEENIKFLNSDEPFEIGDIDISPFKTPHDAAESVGFSFQNKGKKVSLATDIGHVNDYIINKIEGSDILLLESNHDVEMLKFGPYLYVLKRRILSDIGHLSNDDAGTAILKLIKDKYMTVILGHLSKQNNYPELAYKTVTTALEENGVNIEKDVAIHMASRSSVSTFYEL